jgi:hypothetical protein
MSATLTPALSRTPERKIHSFRFPFGREGWVRGFCGEP